MDMGKQQIQPQAGLRSEVEADRSNNGEQPISTELEQKPVLKWVRPSQQFNKPIEDMRRLVAHIAVQHIKMMENQLEQIKRFYNV